MQGFRGVRGEARGETTVSQGMDRKQRRKPWVGYAIVSAGGKRVALLLLEPANAVG